MHIVGTDLCRRLDTEVDVDSIEMAILKTKVDFRFWCMTLLSCFMDRIPLVAVLLSVFFFLYTWRFRRSCECERCDT